MGTGIPADPDAAIGGHSDPVSIAYEAAIVYARNLGAEHGANAAAWYVQDALVRIAGGSALDRGLFLLRGIEDGDPLVLDTFPSPDLSGEWADSLTGPQLLQDAFADADPDHPADEAEFWHADAFSDVCDAYETAFSQAVEDAVASAARAILA